MKINFQFIELFEIEIVGGGAHDAPPIIAPQLLEFPKEIIIYCLSAMAFCLQNARAVEGAGPYKAYTKQLDKLEFERLRSFCILHSAFCI